MQRLPKRTRQLIIGIAGGIVVLCGLVLIPYPGPGWLIVFGGLTVLATEFEIAAKLNERLKGHYNSWTDWLKNQNIFIQGLVLLFTGLVIVLTMWIMNAFGFINDILNLNLDWLNSPIIKK